MENQDNSINEDSFQKENELTGQVVGLMGHLISYFETLVLYFEKVAFLQMQRSIKFLDTLVLVLFIKIIGLLFLSGGAYIGILKLYNGNHLYASLTIGSFLTFISIFLIRYLIKSLKK